MTTKYLLFVEDREEQHMLFRDAIGDWNAANAERRQAFDCHIVSNFADAITAFERTRFDGALVDLRLPDKVPDQASEPLGNELARKGLRENGIPVAIITALKQELDPELEKSPTVRVFDKGDDDPYKAAVEWFGAQWEMMEVLSATRSQIRRISAQLFSDRVWPRWSDYKDAAGNSAASLAPMVTRQFVWHMGEFLGVASESGELWHPFESWLCPPLQPDRPDTGDVFSLDGTLWVVLSPPCDMANNKISDVLLARCDLDAVGDWQPKIDKFRLATDEAQKEKIRGYFRRLTNQGSPSEHFLPPLPGDGRPLMVQFANVTTRPMRELHDRLSDRRASVTAPFLANLTQRFGAYISRVGQPNLDVERFC